MALTKRVEIDQITIDPTTGLVLWRETTTIEEDGVELSQSYHRGSREIDHDLPIPTEVKRVRDLFDTPALRAKAKKKRDDSLAKLTNGQGA